MDQICLVVPITPGKTQDARDFMRNWKKSASPTTTGRGRAAQLDSVALSERPLLAVMMPGSLQACPAWCGAC
jgi:hypothetical protein